MLQHRRQQQADQQNSVQEVKAQAAEQTQPANDNEKDKLLEELKAQQRQIRERGHHRRGFRR